MWAGRAKPGREIDYVAHLEAAVLPEIKALPGYRGAQVMRGAGKAAESFVVLTYWSDLDAVEAFAGPDRDAAVVPEEARRLLAEYDLRVRHFEVVLDDVSA
jgi:heme-degrading monooxygenase HmoA